MSILMNQIVLNATRMAEQPMPVIEVPEGTIRFKFSNTSFTPSTNSSSAKNYVCRFGNWTAVDRANGIWDCKIGSNSQLGGFAFSDNKNCGDVEILACNLTNRTMTLLWSSSYLNSKIKKIYDIYSTNTSNANYLSNISSCPNLEYFRSYSGPMGSYLASMYNDFCYNLQYLKNIPDLGSNFGPNTISLARRSFSYYYSLGCAQRAFNGCSRLENVDNWFRNIFVYSNLAKYLGYEPLPEYNYRYLKYVSSPIDYSTFNGVPNTIIPDYLGGNLSKTLLETYTLDVTGTSSYTKSFSSHPGDIYKITCVRNPNETGSGYVRCSTPSISAYGTEPNNFNFEANISSTTISGWYLTGYSGDVYNNTRTVTLTMTGYGSYQLKGTVTIEHYTYPF